MLKILPYLQGDDYDQDSNGQGSIELTESTYNTSLLSSSLLSSTSLVCVNIISINSASIYLQRCIAP